MPNSGTFYKGAHPHGDFLFFPLPTLRLFVSEAARLHLTERQIQTGTELAVVGGASLQDVIGHMTGSPAGCPNCPLTTRGFSLL